MTPRWFGGRLRTSLWLCDVGRPARSLAQGWLVAGIPGTAGPMSKVDDTAFADDTSGVKAHKATRKRHGKRSESMSIMHVGVLGMLH